MESDKEVRIGIRVTEGIRKDFMDICSEKSYNASALIRSWIISFIEKNRKDQKA